jgi:hypothetical protein
MGRATTTISGSKAAAGVAQRIVSLMPPHELAGVGTLSALITSQFGRRGWKPISAPIYLNLKAFPCPSSRPISGPISGYVVLWVAFHSLHQTRPPQVPSAVNRWLDVPEGIDQRMGAAAEAGPAYVLNSYRDRNAR